MKLFLPFYSVILPICCLLCCSACSRPASISPEDEARASLAMQAAQEKFGVIKDPETQSYLYYLTMRLTSSLSRVGKRCNGCDLTILDTSTPLAYSPGPGHIVISKGMIARVHNEAELAFVVSHEMAHQVLGHHLALKDATLDTTGTEREKLELEADHFAIGMLAIAGYDPRYAPSALLHAYGKVSPDGNAVGYPELYARERQLEDEVMDARWTPPGTVDRREFQKLRREFLAER